MTKVEIFNSCFTELGLKRVSSDDENDKCLALDAIWNVTRDEALIEHDWQFATNIQVLVQPSGVDNYTGYDYVYQLPTDPHCLKIQTLMDDDYDELPSEEYKVMQRYIYTDLEDAYLKYTFRNDELNDWSPTFCVYFAYLLAAKAAMKLVQSDQVEKDMYALAELYKRKAMYAEEDERFVDSEGDSLWVDNR